MKTLELYSDGACHPNPGNGGWACKIINAGAVNGPSAVIKMGYAHDTTNNRMELIALLQGLHYAKSLGPDYRIMAYSDSKYVVDGVTKWIEGWKKRGWKTVEKKPVLNADIWFPLMFYREHFGPRLVMKWVKGHAGNVENEVVDKLCVAQREFGMKKTHLSDLTHIPLFKA